MWRLNVASEKRLTQNADKAHVEIGKNIDRVFTQLDTLSAKVDTLSEKVAGTREDVASLKGHLIPVAYRIPNPPLP